jgi:hypothetical protein
VLRSGRPPPPAPFRDLAAALRGVDQVAASPPRPRPPTRDVCAQELLALDAPAHDDAKARSAPSACVSHLDWVPFLIGAQARAAAIARITALVKVCHTSCSAPPPLCMPSRAEPSFALGAVLGASDNEFKFGWPRAARLILSLPSSQQTLGRSCEVHLFGSAPRLSARMWFELVFAGQIPSHGPRW